MCHQRGPATDRVLKQQGAFGRLDHIDQDPAVAPIALPRVFQVRTHIPAQRRDGRPEPLLEAPRALMPRNTQIAEAHLVRLGHGAVRPGARVQAG